MWLKIVAIFDGFMFGMNGTVLEEYLYFLNQAGGCQLAGFDVRSEKMDAEDMMDSEMCA